MNKRVALEGEKRQVIGKKVKTLRNEGIIPAVVYGPSQEPVPVSINWTNLRIALNEAGGTNLVELNVGDETYTTLIRVVDRDPIRGDVLHVDFYAVDLTQKIVSTIPVNLINREETQARMGPLARIILENQVIDVETLPTDIPSEIILDVSVLENVGDALFVSDLPEMEGVAYHSDPDLVVVRTEYQEEEPEEEEEEEEELLEGAEPELVGRREEEEEEEEEE